MVISGGCIGIIPSELFHWCATGELNAAREAQVGGASEEARARQRPKACRAGQMLRQSLTHLACTRQASRSIGSSRQREAPIARVAAYGSRIRLEPQSEMAPPSPQRANIDRRGRATLFTYLVHSLTTCKYRKQKDIVSYSCESRTRREKWF